MAVIELVEVHKTLAGRHVLRGISFTVHEGETFVLMGRSGIGKSVTLKHIAGVMKPDSGHVRVDGLEVPELEQRELMELRRRMGYLFQNGALINWLSVFDNVSLPLREHTKLSGREIEERVMRMLELVGMEQARDQFPASISGGMKLRAALARAVVTDPQYVLYDEPNAGLDPLMAGQIHDLIVQVRDELGVTGLVVTHSRSCAFDVGNRIGLIEEGRIVEQGTVKEMRASSTPLVREFLGGRAD